MIPLRDANPTREFPIVNYSLIALNILAFLVQLFQGSRVDEFIYRFGIIPERFLGDSGLSLREGSTLFTSMFLHGGWMHIIGNMWFLHVFGDNVEESLGRIRYLVFYLLSGVGAALTQVALNQNSAVPMVGASGAIAGVMGAYVFLYPKARIVTLIPIVVFLQVIEIPAFIFLGLWFLIQMISGLNSLGIASDAGGIAWWAHIGGFAAGVVLLLVSGRKRR